MDSRIGQAERGSVWPLVETMSDVKSSFSWNNLRRRSEALSCSPGQNMLQRSRKRVGTSERQQLGEQFTRSCMRSEWTAAL